MNASGASNSKKSCPPETCDGGDVFEVHVKNDDVVPFNPDTLVVPDDIDTVDYGPATMENFNYPVSRIGCEDKIMQTRRQLEEVMDMMRSNIEKLSERSERLEDLACRAG
ncbi:unnamed protein product [Angiostrongylus costaricensis]|uniref:V-SNARE coiled-coil homology domain-containing protein n=1 Tax=Angiostrongylus costaricensis TaxID=334426 RepID=A0A0R3PXE2_ANGCS|nr:unnamed protein product [Angiostrongylus costaricensis]